MISIIILAYNCENYISDCINSCIEQTRNDLIEVIVVNDGSTDNTQKIISEYKNKIKIFNKENSGIEKSFNYAIKKMKGEFFLRLDADDKLKKNCIENFLKHIHKDYDFFYSDYIIINNKNNILKKTNLPKFNKKEIFKRGDFLATGTLYKKKVLKVNSGYNEDFKNCGLENYEFLLELINKNLIGLLIKKELFYYRIHDKNMSLIKEHQINLYGKNLFKKKKYGKYVINMNHPRKILYAN